MQQNYGSPKAAKRLATIQENEIGTEIMKQFNSTMYRGMVTEYYKYNKQYLVNYEEGDKETMSRNQINRCRCPNRDKDTMRKITRLSTQLHQVNIY